jgi:antitoxin HicB
MSSLDYPFIVRKLSPEEGGGYFVSYPDLPGCFADGETIEDAIEAGRDAINSWIATAKEHNDPIPAPSTNENIYSDFSGRILQRIPKSMHMRLHEKAKLEGISINSLVLSFIAEGLGRKDFPDHNSNT